MSVRIKYEGECVASEKGYPETRHRDSVPRIGEHVQLNNGVYRVENVIHVEEAGQSYYVQVTLKTTKLPKVKKEENYGNW